MTSEQSDRRGEGERGIEAWGLLFLALLFLLPLGWLFVTWGIGAAMSAGGGGGRIGVGYAVFFAAITWTPLYLSLGALKRGRGIGSRFASAIAIAVYALLSLVSVAQLIQEIWRK